MNNYSVEDTLCFFYFGITPDEFENNFMNETLEKIIKKAYFDATMQGAFNAIVKSEEDKDEAKKAKERTIECLKNCIKVLNEEESDSFDDWHKKTCDMVYKQFANIKEDEKPIFTYGNAQKIVNMSLKYLYMLSNSSLYNESNYVLKNIKSNSKFFHMPIDSYIIDQLFRKEIIDDEKDNLKVLLKNDKKARPKKKQLKECSHPYEYIKPWSQWDYKEYILVQNQIRDKISGNYTVIDWENDLWIEEAIRRRDNSKNI